MRTVYINVSKNTAIGLGYRQPPTASSDESIYIISLVSTTGLNKTCRSLTITITQFSR